MSKLKQLLAQPDNRICADCGAPDPKWASTSIGVFICIKCCGVHRSLGVQISKVVSVTLDSWSEDDIAIMEAVGGNAAANSVYEACLPPDVQKPTADASVEERTDWIIRKYKDQEFLKPALRIKTALQSNSSARISVHNTSSRHNTSSSPSLAGMVEFLGMLKVRIVRGIGLAVRDLLSSDPYVVVTLGQQVLKTRVINRSLNPVWNEEIILSVPSPPQPLKLQVFDKDVFSADDIMGDAEVDLNPLILAAQMHEGMFEEYGCEQIGRWLATSDNALVKDSNIEVIDGLIKQDIHLKLQNVEKGELVLSLEWVPLSQ
ncbi:unnamed protein product [Sphagnum jensenii]|uniref:Uncharacterized protein n=1 Tax=Sphagnum jensenii TaxID=128206 RepID=A0ABP0VYR1_9BRYO